MEDDGRRCRDDIGRERTETVSPWNARPDMCPTSSNGVDGETVLSLAERCLENRQRPPDPDMEQVVKEKMKEWGEKLDELNENDPLYRRTKEKYEEQVRRWEELTSEGDAETRFLEAVAEGFVAEGFWLDERVLRALNLLLFGKHSDALVVNRNVIEEGTKFDEETTYEVSTRIRRLAREELDEMRERRDGI